MCDNSKKCLIVKDKMCNHHIWEKGLEYLNSHRLKLLGIAYSEDKLKSCIEGKLTRKPFYKSAKKII